MKVTTDACLFGAWAASEVESEKLKVENILDIGAGTGLLSLMFIQKNPTANIVAVEIDKNAALQAQENVESSLWKDKIVTLEGDVKDYRFPEKFDLIISNPPFYENELKSASEKKNTAHHSSDLTLEELLSIIKEFLYDNGYFFLLLPYKRNEEIKDLFKYHNLNISKIVFVRQSVNHGYFRIMVKGVAKGHYINETEFEEISIWDDKQNYTPLFVHLLKDYYLSL